MVFDDRTMPRHRTGRASAAMLLAALALAALGTAVSAAPPDEVPGNDGTVKIHDGAGEPASEPRNEPHVCTFHLHFMFGDVDDSGTWEIQKWSPGDKGDVVMSGTFTTDGDGEEREPDSGTYSLPDGHYKLFWDGDEDTHKHDKHKVFWVGCPAPTDEPTAEPTDEPTATPTEEPTGTAAPTATDAPNATPSPTPTGGVLPTEGVPSVTPTEPPVGGIETEPPAATLPPTDTEAVTPTGGSALGTVLYLLAGLVALVGLTLPAPDRWRADR